MSQADLMADLMVPIITLSKFPWDQCMSTKMISSEEQKY